MSDEKNWTMQNTMKACHFLTYQRRIRVKTNHCFAVTFLSTQTVTLPELQERLIYYSDFTDFFFIFQEKPNKSKMNYGDKVHYVRIDKVILGEVLDKRDTMQKRKVLICGSKRFNEDIKIMILSSFQIEPDDIHCF